MISFLVSPAFRLMVVPAVTCGDVSFFSGTSRTNPLVLHFEVFEQFSDGGTFSDGVGEEAPSDGLVGELSPIGELP